jgi:hypothetical protein
MLSQIQRAHGGRKPSGTATDNAKVVVLLFNIGHGFDPLVIFGYTRRTLG